jgi:hypothetical protein
MCEKSKKKLLLIYHETNRHLGLWNDLNQDERVVMLCTNEFVNVGFFLSKVRSIHLNYKINRLINLPYKSIWYKYSHLNRYSKIIDKVLVIDGALNQLNIGSLQKLKNKKISCFLYMLNSINASSPILDKIRNKIFSFKWNEVLTFDGDDARKYGFREMPFCYYSCHRIEGGLSQIRDVYFSGGLKGGREPLIFEVLSFLQKSRVAVLFDLTTKENINLQIKEGVEIYKSWIPYEIVLERAKQSNCILEILQEEQGGTSLRYFEAITMNKKLLTTNKNVKNYPFYDSRWIRVFSRVEDIDIDWLVRREYVDYGYNGEFSPLKLVDNIVNE